MAVQDGLRGANLYFVLWWTFNTDLTATDELN